MKTIPAQRQNASVRALGYRWLIAFGSAVVVALAGAVPVRADPTPVGPGSPFPDMTVVTSYYTKLAPDEFFIPDHPGVWFLTPSGLNCGIWDRGGFGCSGPYPGAPAGDDHIAWYNGNRAVHHGWTAAMQFPPGQAQRPLPPLSYVTSNSTTCAVTSESNTYCEHGEFKMFMTPAGTWFKDWDDRQSWGCLSYGSC
jgi:hypothetical protein